MSLQFNLLGPLEIANDGQPSPLLESPKGCALLAYLLVTRQTQTREALADLLWDAASTGQALRNLRALLARIRAWVPELQVTRKALAFKPGPDTIVDLATLQVVLEDQPRADLSPDAAAKLDAALQLYRGDLLAGFSLPDAPRFEEWLVVERERLRQAVLAT
jgi:DNA-binding SARP family transcriptional activator